MDSRNRDKGTGRWANRVVAWDLVPPESLLANPQKYRRHPSRQREALRGSLNELDIIAPVIVNRLTGHLLDGHARVEEYISAGVRQAPVAYVDVPPDKEVLALLSLDPIAAMAEYDKRAVEALLQDASTSEAGLQQMLVELARDVGLCPEEPAEEAEEPGVLLDRADELLRKWVVKPGQIWQAGAHRIACGDCRDTNCLDALMAGRQAQLLWTDPPYGVSYVGGTKAALTIENDAADGLDALLAGSLTAVDRVLELGAPFYMAHPAGPLSLIFMLAIGRIGWWIHQTLVWVKDAMVLGHTDYHYKHEPILYGWKPGPGRSGRGNHEGSRWFGDHSQVSVFEIPRPRRNEEHPTMKPPQLMVPMLRNSSRPGEVVLDSFCGSGSTLVAAEQTGRHGYGVELDPKYVAVILERLAGMGLEPRLG